MKGLVFNIQRFSINDGPGIRTTVFLKGCNLRCQWCHNPESMSPKPELQYFEQLCTNCLECVHNCPVSAITKKPQGKIVIDRELCTLCGKCESVCMSDAMVMAGSYMEATEVIDEVMKDRDYYRSSGGGITISGGEALLQKNFVIEIFKKTKAEGIHNTLDTAANVDWKIVESLVPYLDLVLLDIKHMDTDLHFERTRVHNTRILENARYLSDAGVPIIVRIPVIPSYNDSVEHMEAAATFLGELNTVELVELLPYHTMGVDKNISLGEKMLINIFESPDRDVLKSLVSIFEKHHIPVIVG